MNKHDARAWLRTFVDLPDELRQPCKHGHAQCSTSRDGECLDDVIQAAVIDVEERPECLIPNN